MEIPVPPSLQILLSQFLAGHRDRYDFGWLVENDTFYTGPWKEFFHEEMKDTCLDLMSPFTVYEGTQDNDWWHLRPIAKCHVDGRPFASMLIQSLALCNVVKR